MHPTFAEYREENLNAYLAYTATYNDDDCAEFFSHKSTKNSFYIVWVGNSSVCLDCLDSACMRQVAPFPTALCAVPKYVPH